jgi:hypothetical protein
MGIFRIAAAIAAMLGTSFVDLCPDWIRIQECRNDPTKTEKS